MAKHIIEIWLDDLQIIQCANICSTYKRKEEMEGRPLSKNQETCLLQIKGVRKSFGMNAVLKGINLTLDRGEVLALIGGNGAGKSTLMKIIMGLYTEDEGDIFIDQLDQFAEAGACGTAAVISPIGGIYYQNNLHVFHSETEVGPVTKRLYDELTGIQFGDVEAPEGWIEVVE